MNTIEKLYRLISHSKVLILFISLFAYIIFLSPIEKLLSGTVVKYGFSHVSSVWYNDALFIIIACGALLSTAYRLRNYTPSIGLSSLLLSVTTIYVIYRITGKTWDFIPFSIWSGIKYTDILIILSICNLLLFIPLKDATHTIGLNAFYEDQPLGLEGMDELGYNPYAELLGEKILSSHFNRSFAIGINGKWGLGKTSFIDLLKRKIKNQDIIEINFNAWNSNSPKALIKDFFESIQEAIRPYHSSLSRLIIQYSNKLVDLNNNKVTQSIQTTVSAIIGSESQTRLFQDINNALTAINKKIVVYIDDLDRLDTHEIIEVIRLIRNTANFHNTYFIVAYDRNYIVNALKQFNPYKQEEFLEKIFQVEVTLPFYSKDILRYKLSEKLKAKLPERVHTTIENEVIGTFSAVPLFLNEWLESMRDVTRLANALILNLSRLIGEIDFNDFMRIELLRLKYPSAYELLFRKTLNFLETTSDQSTLKNQYHLKNIPENEKNSSSETEKHIKTYFESYLVKNHLELSIPKNDISKIVSFVDGIFGGGVSFGYYSRSHLSITYPSRFNLYFAYAFLEGALSEIEFSQARILNQVKFNEKIDQWLEKGLELQVKNRFGVIKSFDDREDFEKVIRAIFHLANLPSMVFNSTSRFFIVGYDVKDLIDKIRIFNKESNEIYYPEGKREEGLKAFISGLFNQAISPYFYEADLLYYLNDQLSYDFVLDKDKLKEINIKYFRQYCSKNQKLDYHVWHLFYCCKQTEWKESEGSLYTKQEIFPATAKKIMKNFVINKDLNGFLLEMIEIKPFHSKIYAVSKLTIEIFDNWKAFEKELAKIDDGSSSYLTEFRVFLTEFASKGYSNYVEFEFKIIPINKKFSE